MSEERKIRNDIVAVGLLSLIIFLAASLATYDPRDPAYAASSWLNTIYQPDQLYYPSHEGFQNACGRLGAWTADLLLNALGVGAYFLVVGLVAMEIALFQRQSLETPWLKTTGWALSLLGLTSLAAIALPSTWMTPLIGPGGYLGALGSGLLANYLGSVGCLVGSVSLFLIGMMMGTEYLVFRAGRIVFAPALVKASRMLPFGVVHRALTWFNGAAGRLGRDVETDDWELEDEAEEDLPRRTIRFRRRDQEWSEEDEFEASLNAAEAEREDDEEFLEPELEDEEEVQLFQGEEEPFEAIEDEVQPVRVAARTKAPQPAVSTEPAQETSTSAIPKPHFKIRKPDAPPVKAAPEAEPSEREVVMNQLDAAAAAEQAVVDYELPSIEMLESGDQVPFEQQKREALKKAEVLEKTCKQFGYDVKVVEIETGPVISQYEIELAPGLRLQKITALADDLAIAMRVPSVRIVAPIPGKNSVGVEVPNETRQVVRLREVMEQSEKQIRKMKIPLFLGADAVGAPLVADLASLPHLLIAGRTGTGKSVCLNAIIASMLMTRRPDEVRMLMIDPKMVELSGYGKLPHLMHPVVTDMRKAEAILAWAVDKMEERYALLAKAGVRHVTSYNQLDYDEILERIDPESEAERLQIPRKLPFIVIVADEMADLMMTAGKDVEQHIIRLAQKSRAVGIHLILATQKPTVDVITGLIKSNLPARISFQVASKTDSRVVLDAQGADKLLGMGDMLFLWPGTSNLLRGQGTYLSDPEIDRVTDAVCTGEQNFVHELVNIKVKTDEEESEDPPKQLESRDELYEEAITVVVKEQRGSCSLLQRAMGIGYGRAARLIDFMAEDGYVGPYNGSKAREVLLTEAQWEAILAGENPDRESGSRGDAVAPALAPQDLDVPDTEVTDVVVDPPSAGPKRPKSRQLRRGEAGMASHLAAKSFPVPQDPAAEDPGELDADDEDRGQENPGTGNHGTPARMLGSEELDDDYDGEYDDEEYEGEDDEYEEEDEEYEYEDEDEEYEDVDDDEYEYDDEEDEE